MEEIYLDNSATTRVLPEAVEAITEACSLYYGNPSSLHGKGLEAEKQVHRAREVLGGVLSCRPEEVYFTSGGTESNSWAILGSVGRRRRRGRHLITTKIEHPSVLKVFQFLENNGYDVTYLDPDSSGIVAAGQLTASLREDTVLVSAMYVNNETGAIQPVEKMVKAVKGFNPDILFHVDAVQALGKLPLKPGRWGVDLMSLTAHKIHGPKGVGALFVKKGANIDPLFLGGEQESRMRAGTENVPGIVGFAAAVEQVPGWLERTAEIAVLKEQLLTGLQEQLPEVVVNGSLDQAIPNVLNLSFPGVKGEVLVHYLEQSGIFVSTGSACHSRSAKGSHVLEAMGVEGALLEGAIRISFSHYNTQDEAVFAAEKIAAAVQDLQSLR